MEYGARSRRSLVAVPVPIRDNYIVPETAPFHLTGYPDAVTRR